MVRVTELYSGNFITAAELPAGRRVPAVIAAAEIEAIGQDQQNKLVLRLKAHDGRPWPRGVVLNKTNALVLAAAFGDDTTDWLGRSIEVWKEPVQFQGRMVQGIRTAPATIPVAPGQAGTAVSRGGPGSDGAAQPSVHQAVVAAASNPPERQATGAPAWNGGDIDNDEIPFD
jgi:hypothetical protein